MGIPKKIHYCWFGGAAKPPLVERCLKSWTRFLPDYEIVEWNEVNFDVNSHPFTRLMYARRKWAFLTDYVRMWAVYNHGGIYLDSDCEVFRSLDAFLDNRAFIGFERYFIGLSPFTACFGAEANHPWARDCLAYYDSVDLSNERVVYKTNTEIVSHYVLDLCGATMVDRFQRLSDGLVIYPSYVLCTPNYWHRRYVVHHFNGSWLPNVAKGYQVPRKIFELIFRAAPVFFHGAIRCVVVFLISLRRWLS